MKEMYVLLSMIVGFGPFTQSGLLDLCGGVEELFRMSREEMEQLNSQQERLHRLRRGVIERFVSEREDPALRQNAESVLKMCEAGGIWIITREEENYPKRLLGLPGAPVLLYGKGELRINEFERAVTVTGSIDCAQEIKSRAIRLVEAETAAGSAVISGISKGIDTCVHTAVLKEEGYSIAVLVSGPDLCYPKENKTLCEAIAQSGCILSEYPPGTRAMPFRFPHRNRLLAGLCDEMYIMGAESHSGTGSLTEYCERYERRVSWE